MTQTSENMSIPDAALIYCRVSIKKQAIEATGLDAQEHRCREHAAKLGVGVEAVFYDDVSGGGDFMKRKGMVDLLGFLDTNKDKRYVVIFDDLKRYSRDTEFHLRLRREMQLRNAIRICLNFNFEDSPEGKFLETILAATGTLEREQNAMQVSQKMKARVEQGFWVTHAPVGYKYVRSKRGGKELVFDEPLATIAKEALEGFASGRFETQAEVKRFLESQPDYPKDLSNGKIRSYTITRFLRKIVYAGYVESKAWNVLPRPSHHQGLIDLQTHEKILLRLKKGGYAPARKDIHKDFPLRGFVTCAGCGNPYKAGWTKGKTKLYPYYTCQTKKCPDYGKSIKRAEIESGFEAILQSMTPSQKLFVTMKAMINSAWEQRKAQIGAIKATFKRDITKLEKEIDEFLNRIVNTQTASVINVYEKKIAELEKSKLLAEEKLAQTSTQKGSKTKSLELSLQILSIPWKIWENGTLLNRKMLFRLAFLDRLTYCRIGGYKTPKISILFKVLGEIQDNKCKMVRVE